MKLKFWTMAYNCSCPAIYNTHRNLLSTSILFGNCSPLFQCTCVSFSRCMLNLRTLCSLVRVSSLLVTVFNLFTQLLFQLLPVHSRPLLHAWREVRNDRHTFLGRSANYWLTNLKKMKIFRFYRQVIRLNCSGTTGLNSISANFITLEILISVLASNSTLEKLLTGTRTPIITAYCLWG